MILKYNLSDNRLEKKDPTDFPNHLQDNIVLQFEDKDGIINDKSYVFIKTHDNVKRVKIVKNGDICACELPPFVTHNTFFKLRVMSLQGMHQMITNEIIVPIRVNDYLDYNRTLAHMLPKPKGTIDDDSLYSISSDWDIASDSITESELNTILTNRLSKELNGLDERVDEKMSGKADRVHEHNHSDVTDWDEEVDENINLLLYNLTNRIRGI